MSPSVGLDIGNSRCVIAVCTDGKTDLILNEASKRPETPTAVHFASNHRLFGFAATSFAAVSPESTISQLKSVVGSRNEIEVEMGCSGEKRRFTPVQLLAMLLSHLKRGAGRTLGSEASDCVIGVPGYFSKEQKNAYRDAACVAGWRPWALLDEGDATALVYATERLREAADGRVVAFVDIGHSGTQISVVRFDGEKRRVVSEASDENLGGRDFDRVLFRYFQRKFKKEHAIDVVSNAKAKAKLWIACEKAKTVLSANREAQVSLESLMDDTDVKGQITRGEFEKKSLTLVDRIAELFEEALSDADCVIHSVELVGSGSRIPAISRRLTEIFGREISRTINGSECVARGCALFCEQLIFNDRMKIDRCEYIDVSPPVSYIPELQRQEEELAKMDERHERVQRCRNNLESFISQERNKRSKDKNGVSSKEDENLLRILEQTEDWLYKNGEDQSEEVYKEKLEELRQQFHALMIVQEEEKKKPSVRYGSVSAFIDIDDSHTQVTLVSSVCGNMNLLDRSCDRNLGGKAFDEVLFQYFVRKLRDRYKIDVGSDEEACVRLREACQNSKKDLSRMNKSLIRLDRLMHGVDVREVITIEELESSCSDVLQRIADLFCRVLSCENSPGMEEIQSIQLLGSGSWVPAIARKLQEIAGLEVSRTPVASECSVRDQLALLVPSRAPQQNKLHSPVERCYPTPLAIGIDIGNEKCVVAISNSRTADAVLNEEAKRETPTLVHFAKNHRLFGTAATTYATANPKSTISQLKRLLVTGDRRRKRDALPYDIFQDSDGEIVVSVDEEREFTATEMIGMLLDHLKRSAERTLGSTISLCVIGVPSYFRRRQRQAYIDAAEIAGLTLLELLRDGDATAIEYVCSRPATGGVIVVFVDVGHCDTQVTVVGSLAEAFNVRGRASDPDLGGRDFDEVIFDYFVEKFKREYEIDCGWNAKAKVRLRMACEKAKKVLSANREAEISVECLMDGVDVKGLITREEFESLSSGLVTRIGDLFCTALDRAKLSPHEVHSVELVGSGSRIPAISRRLSEIFGRETSRTLNGSECVARGCALRCEQLIRMNMTGGCKQHKDERSIAMLDASKVKEKELLELDRDREQAKVSRSTLESCIHSARDKLRKGAKRDSDDGILSRLTDIEHWLYNDGEDEPKDVYEDKIQEVNFLLGSVASQVTDKDVFEDKIQEVNSLLGSVASQEVTDKPPTRKPPTRDSHRLIPKQDSKGKGKGKGKLPMLFGRSIKL